MELSIRSIVISVFMFFVFHKGIIAVFKKIILHWLTVVHKYLKLGYNFVALLFSIIIFHIYIDCLVFIPLLLILQIIFLLLRKPLLLTRITSVGYFLVFYYFET